MKLEAAHGAGENLRHKNEVESDIAAVNVRYQTGTNRVEYAEAATGSYREKPKHGKKS